MLRRCRALWLCLWTAAFGQIMAPAQARTDLDEALRCDQAADQAARATGVPAAVLMAIARVETGRTIGGALAPWPWTVNEAGVGSFFETEDKALQHVTEAMATGATNIDIGCFQVNLRWHGVKFASLDAMFDPVENALYAARFLQTLYGEHGSWDGAVGAYHSRRPDAAQGYLRKVANVLEAPLPTNALVEGRVAGTATVPRENRFPLLQGGTGGENGSLFSGRATGARPLLR